jgi:hypothetical protein
MVMGTICTVLPLRTCIVHLTGTPATLKHTELHHSQNMKQLHDCKQVHSRGKTYSAHSWHILRHLWGTAFKQLHTLHYIGVNAHMNQCTWTWKSLHTFIILWITLIQNKQ